MRTFIIISLILTLFPNPQKTGRDQMIDSLISRMTVEEKLGQLTQYTDNDGVTGEEFVSGFVDEIRAGRCGSVLNCTGAARTRDLQRIAVEQTRLGIPLLFGQDIIHGCRTSFPVPLGESASWDLGLIEKDSRIAATEAAAMGIHWTFAPMVDICVDPRWGRVMEGSGEDPYLGSRIAAAKVKGFQGNDLSDTTTVAACVKHFAAYGAAQSGRDYNPADISRRTFYDYYLPPYKAAVEAGARSVMSSFNEIDGRPATVNKALMVDLLRDKLGFDGVLVTDYTALKETIAHGTSADLLDAGVQGIKAQVDIDMISGAFIILADKIKDGTVSMAEIDRAVRRVLTLKADLGLFDDPYRYCSLEREKNTMMRKEYLQTAQQMAEESFVLLQNDGTLPLRKGVRVALIGDLASQRRALSGGWAGMARGEDNRTVLEEMRDYCGASNVIYASGCKPVFGSDESGFKEAVAAARKADVVVMVMGEDYTYTGEAKSRADITLPGSQTALIEKLSALGKPLVLVLMNGRPLDLSRESALCGSILETWYPGVRGGAAIVRTLFGDVNPSGKLTITFPRSVGQIPIFYYMKNTGRPAGKDYQSYRSMYIDEKISPLYPFGHGLSYTAFSYTDVKLSAARMGKGGHLTASALVTNTGKVGGTEVVQMYIHDLLGSVTRPVKELKGFQRVTLAPGESSIVSFDIDAQTLSFYRYDMTWGYESGAFDVFIGGTSDIPQSQAVRFVAE